MGRHPSSIDDSQQIANRPTDEAIECQILSKVGKPVEFKYPGDEGELCGILKDRVVIKSAPNLQGIPYWDVVDLIEFPGAPEPLWMRVGYYRYAKGRLVWGSQTTLTEPLSIWRELFEASRARPWFAPLLRK
jgi:hypothetical protein